MGLLEENSVDAVVTDPPYGLGFMGQAWDRFGSAARGYKTEQDLKATPYSRARAEFGGASYGHDHNRRMVAFQDWTTTWAAEALRVLKPGGYLLSFGGTRTYHRMAAGVEDAGFEIRDQLQWLYGQGFPKSMDVGKAIDKAAGAQREVVGINQDYLRRKPNGMKTPGATAYGYSQHQQQTDARITAPATPDAQRWDGWGTALKPAHEPIVLARKPLAGTVAANVLAWGVGGLNIDAARIPTEESLNGGAYSKGKHDDGEWGTMHRFTGRGYTQPVGRWPANVVLDEDAAALLDAQSAGTRAAKPAATGTGWAAKGMFPIENALPRSHTDSGGASRFFYTAKASRSERELGLEGAPATRLPSDGYGSIQQPKLDRVAPREHWTPHPTANTHPTVKPLALMRWLVRLVTPPGGLVLDPFTGSGTTALACIAEGMDFLGYEADPAYAVLAQTRIRNVWDRRA